MPGSMAAPAGTVLAGAGYASGHFTGGGKFSLKWIAPSWLLRELLVPASP